MSSDHLHLGLLAFERGDFYEAHEHWEDAWNALARDDAGRVRVQALVQVAVALHHLERGRLGPALSVMRRACDKLAQAGRAGDVGAVDVDVLRSHVTRALDAMTAGAPIDPRSVRAR